MSRFLVTGGAGFIGSNVVRRLLALGERIRVIDDCSTGHRANLAEIAGEIEFVNGSIADRLTMDAAIQDCDYCIHLAAIPSVPRSVENPARSHHANVTGTVNVLLAARDAGVQRVVVASSSSVYGNAAALPVDESLPVMPISPYAVSKASAEMYARVFSELYELEIVCLRYFNVFGPRQDPDSPYSAVIPLFIRRMLGGHAPRIHGDGLQSRDFTFVENVAAANIKACFAPGKISGCYNVAGGQPHSLLELVQTLNDILGKDIAPSFEETRAGDVKHSHAAIARAETAFGYKPRVSFREGLEQTVAWYQAQATPEETRVAVGD